jgi:hypothetical protein
MLRVFGKSLAAIAVTTGATSAAYYTYRSWDDDKKQQCQKLEERAVRRLPPALTKDGTLLSDILRSEKGESDGKGE